MPPNVVKVEPSQDVSHSRLRMTLELSGPLTAWQLTDFAQLLRAWTRRRTRVVLSAAAPGEWLDEWCLALEETELEVEFRQPRPRRVGG